jgi:RHS repeat-associated protein
MSGTSSGYFARLRATFGVYYAEILVEQNGNWTTLDSEFADTNSGLVQLEVVGSSINMYLNGTLVADAVDSTITTAGDVGVIANGDGNVAVGNFSAAAYTPSSPQNATLPFSDDFDRESGMNIGAYWTEQQGNLAISNDEITNVVTGESSMTVNGATATDVILTADVDLTGGYLFGSSVGLDARVTSDSEYRGEIVKDGGYTAEILRDDDGTWTILTQAQTSGSGTLRFEVIGSSLNLYLNGIPIATATDSTYDSAGAVGIDMSASEFTHGVTLGDFSAEVAPTPPTPQNATLPYSDNFQRADNSLVSPVWTTEQGVIAIGQDQLMTLDSAATSAVLNGISQTGVSMVASFNMNLGSSTFGLDARASGNNEYQGQITESFGTWYAQILAEVNGNWATLDSRTISWPLSNGRPVDVGMGTLEFDVSGGQLGLYLNGQLVAAAGDTSVSAAGTVGIYSNGTVALQSLSVSALTPPAPQNASLTFDDDFDRADDAITLGPSWIQQTGDIAVWNDQAADMGLGTSVATVAGIDQANEIVSGQVDVPVGQTIGLVARYSGTGNANYYFGTLSGSGMAEIGVSVDGTVTSLATATAPGTSGNLRLEVVGDQLQLFLNNALLLTVTDSTLTGAGSVGIIGTHTTSDGDTDATLTGFDARAPLSIPDAVLAIPTSSPAVVDYWEPGIALTNLVTGDFNGDGKTDVAGYDPTTGNWVVGLSNGTGGFTTQTWGNFSPSVDWSNVVVGDFNGSGLADIAAYDAASGTWYVAISNGSSFTTTTWATWNSSHTYQDVEVGDFNGDGRDDISSWDQTAGAWIVATSSGVSFSTSTWGQGNAGTSWEAVVVGDFNGDGRDDIAALNGSTGAWNVELSNGNYFNDSIWGYWNSSVAWTNVYAADFTGNGLDDLIGTAPGSTSWQVSLSTGSAFVNENWGTEAANLTDEQIGDFNGDGMADIAGQVIGTNQWRIETSTGSGFTDQYWLTTSAAVNIQGVLTGNTLALEQAAAQDFAEVYNNIQYQPYAGEMKGPQATQETGEGNDWDQDALLIQLLSQSGIQAQYEYGQISMPTAEVLSWLGVQDTAAAEGVLNSAGLDPTVLNSGQSDESIEFNHVWVEALLPGPNGLQWTSMDPSIKFQNTQAGIGGLSTSVPFDQTDYLANTSSQSPLEFYEAQIASYLVANDPTQSLADVPNSGPIIAEQFSSIPSALPFTVVGTPTTYTSVPQIMTDRVEIVLQDVLYGGVWETPLDYTVSVPAVALDTIAITYTQASDGNYMPELRINGLIVQASSSEYVVGADTMQLLIEHYNAGSNTISSTSTYDQNPGITMAIGLDADQFSNASVEALQTQVNNESLAVENGDTSQTQAAFDDGLSLTVEEYFEQDDQAANIIAGLNHLVNVYASVGDGILISDPSQIQYNWYTDVPITSIDTGFDIEGGAPGVMLATNGENGQYDDRLNALTLLALEDSFLESSIPESVLSLQSVSAVSGIQWANANGIPVLTINDSNESTLLPELTIPSSQVSFVQGFLNQGDTVIIPRDELTIGSWSGTAMILQNITSTSFYEGDAVIGNYLAHGGFGDDYDPNNPAPPTNPNQKHSGDPVDTATGAFTREDTDVTIPNIGIPLTFARYYTSNSSIDIGLGQGWTDTYSDTMVVQSDGDVLWTDSEGDQYTFTPNGSSGYTNPEGLFGTLTLGTSGFVWTDTHGNIRAFNSAGRLAEIEDANGNSLIISYNAEGNLASVQDGADPSLELTFTSTDGHITSMTDFTGRTWTYTYETTTLASTGQTIYLLASCTSPSDDTTPADTTEYGYDLTGALTGLMISITDSADGESIQINYYPNGKAFSVTDPVGNTEYFFYDLGTNEATYINALGQAQVDEFNSQGLTVKQINPDQTFVTSVWSNGLLQSRTDAMGETSTYEYDLNGNLIQYTAPDGIETDTQYSSSLNLPTEVTVGGVASTIYTYDDHGNVTSVTDAMGDETTMTYYSDGLLETLTAPNGNVADPNGDYTTTYTYNGAGQVLTTTTGLPSTITNTYDDRGDLMSTTDADGNTTTYTYDLLGRLLTTTDPSPDGTGTGAVTTESYNLADDEVTETDPLGNQTETYSDGDDRIIKVVNPNGTFTTNTYDAVGNLIDSTNESGQTTQYIYDDENRLIETLFPNGTSTSTTCNADGQVSSSTDADGNTTQYAYNASGQLLSVTNALGQITSYTYDDLGNVATVTNPSGTTTFTRDLLGRITETAAPGNVITTTDYDADGNVINQTLYDVSGLSPIPSNPRTLPSSRKESTTTVYDVLDRPIEVTDPNGNTTYTTYNADGQVTSTTNASGAVTSNSYDDDGRLISQTAPNPDGSGTVTTTDTYDADNNLISQTDGLGNTTTYAYNDMNELVAETEPAPTGGAAAPVTTYQYNVDGERTSETDPDGNTTFYTYNSVGEEVKEINSLGSTWTYQYDPVGNLISTTDADGRTTTYTYNALNQMTSENWIGSGGSVIYSIQYTYNDQDELETVTDPDSSYTYTYTAAGQVASVDNAGTPNVPDVVLSQTYDGFGNESSLSASVGGTSEFTNNYLYNPDGDMTQETQSGSGVSDKEVTFAYNALGQLTSINAYASTDGGSPIYSASYGYNGAEQLTSLDYANASDSGIENYGYSYNANGQITQMTDSDGTTNYTYDNDGQLSGASGSALPASESYSYDADGNRTNSGDTTGTNNELTSDGTYDYSYDADGNLIQQTDIATGATENFTWDYRNRLTEVTLKNSSGVITEQIQYTYNALNQRISQTVTNGSNEVTLQESYIYDGSNLLMVLNGSGDVTHTFLNGTNGQALADDGGSGNVTWMLADQEGSVRDVINNSGTDVDHIVYDAYGNILSQTSSANQPRFAFGGMQLDTATGLYYDSARYYDSSTGQFISQDPSGFAGGNTNLQGYVNNDPVNLIDPTGLSPKGNSSAGPGGPGSSGNGGPGSGGPGSSGSNSSGNNRGGYQYTDEQLGSGRFSNFINELLGLDDYGTADQVTQPQSIQNTVEVAQTVSNVAFTGAAILSGAAAGEALLLDMGEVSAETLAAIDSAAAVESGTITVNAAAEVAEGTQAAATVLSETEVATAEASEAEAVNAPTATTDTAAENAAESGASATQLIGFNETESAMIQQATTDLSNAGYDVSQLQQLVKADMPEGYRAMSLSSTPTGAALSNEAFSSQATLNSALEEELLHLGQNLPSQTFVPGTAAANEEAANAVRIFQKGG